MVTNQDKTCLNSKSSSWLSQILIVVITQRIGNLIRSIRLARFISLIIVIRL
jgi:hypothetical protein